AIAACEYLPRYGRSSMGVEQHQAVGGGHVHRVARGVGDESVNTEEMVVLDMLRATGSEIEHVQPAIEVAYPEAAIRREAQRRNVTVGDRLRRRWASRRMAASG